MNCTAHHNACDCREEKFRDLKARNKLLIAFAKYVIIGGCWKGLEMDGGDIQKMAEELHLIEPHIVTASEADDMFEAGDTKFVFTKWLGD